jgi:hypothetical protein
VTTTTEGTLLGADNVSLASMWAKWLGIGAAATALATVTTGAMLGLVASAWVRRREIVYPDYLEFSLLLLLIPLLSPQGWDYVFLIGTPAVMLLINALPSLPTGLRYATIGSIAVVALSIFDIMGRAAYSTFMGLSLITVLVLVQYAALVTLRFRRAA